MQSTSGNPWWPLVLLTHAAAGLYFAYETAGALAPDLQDEMGFTNQQIGLMYSAYSIPVIGSIFVSEFLNRKLGASKCILLFSFCIALGTFVVGIAPNFEVMFAGQIIYGAGSSPMYLTSTIVLGKWFGNDAAAKKKVSIAFGFVFAWCRLFSFAAFMLLPIISSHLGLRFALGFSAFICATSFVAGAFFFVVDYYKKYTSIEMPDEVALQQTEDSTKKSHSAKSTESLSLLNSTDDGNEEDKTKENNEDINGDRVVATFVVGAEGTSTAIDSDESGSREEEDEEDDEAEEKSKNKKNRDRDIDMERGIIETDKKEIVHTSLIKKWKADIVDTYHVMKTFPLAYWLILALVILFISDLYTCTAFLTQYLHEEWNLDKEPAAAVTSLVCLTNVITSPIAGWLAGYTGWKVKFIILGALNLLLIHFFFTTKIIPVVVLVCALGLTQSIMDTNLTPSFVFLIPRKNYSIALALCSICYNTGLLLFPMICGFLRDAMENWNGVNMAFITASILAVIFSLILKFVDMRNGNVLDLPFKKSQNI